ncbi:MAG TPA: DUF4010 domain-containing protein [Myxococcaceae bacterium]
MGFDERPEWRLLVALGVGLVVGLERERARDAQRPRRWAGLRTFGLTSLLGGVVLQTGSPVVVGVAGMAVVLLAVVMAWRANEPDPGLTTEVALVLTFALGVLSQEAPALAFGAALVTTALLALRARLHGLARKLFSDRELQNALVLGVSAVLVLPLLPDRPVDPFGAISPFDVWKLVVVVVGVSALGALAQRIVRPRAGLTVAGLASGFVSSAATIASMGRLAATEPKILPAAVSGATASSVATFVELALLLAASGPVLLGSMAAPLIAGGVTALVVAFLFARRAAKAEAPPVRSGGAFRLVDAVVFAVLVTAISFVAAAVQHRFGSAGVLLTAAVSGLADAHAVAGSAGSLAARSAIPLRDAGLAVLLGLSTNAVTKVVLAATSGPPPYLVRVLAGQVAVIAATWAGWLLGGR